MAASHAAPIHHGASHAAIGTIPAIQPSPIAISTTGADGTSCTALAKRNWPREGGQFRLNDYRPELNANLREYPLQVDVRIRGVTKVGGRAGAHRGYLHTHALGLHNFDQSLEVAVA